MKLFQRLLVAPALLGFIVPVTAKATETNLDAISNYYQENVDLNSNSFKSNTENKNLLLSGGEGLIESSSSDPIGGFSDTTTASFGVNFYVGAVDGGSVVTEGNLNFATPTDGDGTVSLDEIMKSTEELQDIEEKSTQDVTEKEVEVEELDDGNTKF